MSRFSRSIVTLSVVTFFGLALGACSDVAGPAIGDECVATLSGHDGSNFSGHDGSNFSGHDGSNFSAALCMQDRLESPVLGDVTTGPDGTLTD